MKETIAILKDSRFYLFLVFLKFSDYILLIIIIILKLIDFLRRISGGNFGRNFFSINRIILALASASTRPFSSSYTT